MARRQALALLGMGGLALAGNAVASSTAAAQEAPTDAGGRTFPTVADLQADATLQNGQFAFTLGYHKPGDGGSALYQIAETDKKRFANGGDVIELKSGKHALLLADGPINYLMFGATGDGKNDDGVQIKQAHQFAQKHQLPIVQRSGEFWIIQTNGIPITTNVDWGNTIFHIDEKHNQKAKPRFVVRGLKPAQPIKLDEKQKASFLKNLQPGVMILPEMAPYKNCLVTVADSEDRIGFRAGDKYKGQSWAREELFYVEEEGRIIGDIAWKFTNYTSLTAYPCDDTYLIIEGGGFYLSGDNPGEKYSGYYSNGFSIQRSRTIVRNQWMGLEPGQRDISMEPRSGFYTLSRVFDVTLENIRLIPWEQNRSDPKKKVGAGTYGISGVRMLNCTFRNLTAEGTYLHWGVFGTNLNKNFRIENCRLNRVDVHFHCHNLTIQDSVIGLRGISITGGGELTIENCVHHGNTLVNFRRDFGAKWDGDIRIRNCRIVPPRDRRVAVLSSSPSNFDYGYPIGCGRTIDIENLVVDFHQFPESTAPVYLLSVASYSLTADDSRHFFPHHFSARNVTVAGRQQGVRIVDIPEPYHYLLAKEGSYDGDRLQANCQMVFENLVLEEIPAGAAGSPEAAHLRLGKTGKESYTDGRALYPHIRITNCPNLCLYLGGSAADVTVTDSTIDRLTAAAEGPLRGRLVLTNCEFVPNVKSGDGLIYALDAELGTHLTNTTLHPPRIDGTPAPETFDRFDFVQLNQRVRYYQLNTTLSNSLLKHLEEQKVELQPGFVTMLKSHHGLEPETL